MSSESSTSRRFWRFSVRQLLALSAALGVLLATLAPHVQSMLQLRKAQHALYAPARRQQALNSAIVAGQADRVRQALEAGANLSVGMNDGSSPLHGAITLGRCEAVQALLDYVADIEQIGQYNDHPGRYRSAPRRGPPLFAAVDCNQPTDIKIQMIRILLARGANIRCEVRDLNLMDLAAFRGDGALGDFLQAQGLPYGPREMAAFNRIEELQRAIQESPDLLRERFEPMGLERVGEKGQVGTLLGIALSKNYRDMARMLIEAGAPLNALEPGGQTPLHIAATHSGDPELIRLLIAHGADVNARDDDQLTPLAATRDWSGRETARAALLEAAK